MLRIRDLARALGLSPTTIRRRIDDKTIAARKIGGSVRIPATEIARLTAPTTA